MNTAPLSPMQAQFVALANRPNGIASTDTGTGLTDTQIRSLTTALRNKGLLYTCRISHRVARHFGTLAGLNDYMARTGHSRWLAKDEIKPRDVSYFEPSQKLDKAAKVVIPASVKRTEAAPFVDLRYAVPAGFRGELSREWAELRGAA